MNRFRSVSAVAVFVLADAAAANLLANGGFETGDFSAWTVTPAAMGSSVGVTSDAHSGMFAASFAASGPGVDRIAQTVGTMSNANYSITGWILNLGVGDDEFTVTWDGATIFSASPIPTPLETWTFFLFEATASGSATELAFSGFDGISSFVLDDLSVTLVPAPASAVVVCLLGLGATRRRRAMGV